jgi:HAD superfamily phosphatase (TIGR01681 family)
MAVGSCLLSGWPAIIQGSKPGCPCDFYQINNAAELPPSPPHPADEYDFQLVQVPLRTVLPEAAYFRLSYADVAAYETLFAESVERLRQSLTAMMRWNIEHGMLTFVFNFRTPQQNPMGRLLPRCDLRNLMYFVEKLNECLAKELEQYRNCYLFDIDNLARSIGKKYCSDDVMHQSNHGTGLTQIDFAHDQERLEKISPAPTYYPQKLAQFIKASWVELVAMYRTTLQIDAVKLVVMDLDDTMWRGVVAENAGNFTPHMEGWPVGMIEALGYLKRRGVLLAIISKNDDDRIVGLWDQVVGNSRISLDDFAVRKINWKPKAENFAEVLRETNLLAKNVLFIDDNPVERASVQAAYPELRTLGPNPYLWRRILLWSAETQVANVTAESNARTEMLQAQVQREGQRQAMSRQDFLASLKLSVSMMSIMSNFRGRWNC